MIETFLLEWSEAAVNGLQGLWPTSPHEIFLALTIKLSVQTELSAIA